MFYQNFIKLTFLSKHGNTVKNKLNLVKCVEELLHKIQNGKKLIQKYTEEKQFS